MTGLVWLGFIGFVVVMVALDLGVFHRRAHVVRVPEALVWTVVWIALALAFNVLVYFLYEGNWGGWSSALSHQLTGRQAALQFFTGYVVEKSLSIDNIFVIAMVFAYFRVPLAQQHRLLIWGVLGAVVLRGVMIAAGAVLIARFEWIVYVFGVLLLASAAKMLVTRHDSLDPDRNVAVRLTRRFYPVTSEYEGSRFFTKVGGQRAATPLFLALILVESSDVMFAIDSIPAIFAITTDPFLIFTSNVFAILGLRSLYFALAGLMDRFRYLKTSLVFVLAYVGVKMLLTHHHPIPNLVSLGIIGGILGVGVLASVTAGHKDTAALMSPIVHELEDLATLTYRQARRIVILIVGLTVLLIGVVMIVLPGPALLVIPLGLSLLAIEFAWARRWLKELRETAAGVGQYVSKAFGRMTGRDRPRGDR
jgi:tellurite resistance protein TerC